MKKILITGGMIVVLSLLTSGCTSTDIDLYQGSTPVMDAREFFQGRIRAWGIIQNWRGEVTSRFDADMLGTWEGNSGTLEEIFTYYDGRTQERVWTLHLEPEGRLLGTAPDVLDAAQGKQSGSALNLRYRMDLEVGGRTFRLSFDDWMWRMNDNLVINRAYIKKFGITVAQLTVVMQKQTQDES